MIKKKKKKSAGFVIKIVLFSCFAMVSCFIAFGQSIRWQDNGVVVNIQSNPDTIYKILCSENLEDWHLVSIMSGTGQRIDWTDLETDGVNQKFYTVEQINKDVAVEMDFDGDGFDDVYELNHIASGMDPMVPNTVQATSVSVLKTAIASGARQSDSYQTEVIVRVSPAMACPVRVWLEGGDGFGTGSVEHFNGGWRNQYGPAQIAWNGQVLSAGVPVSGEQAIEVMTDANGEARLTLTSSNEINEMCIVHARAGTLHRDGSQAQSEAVRFEPGELQLALLPNSIWLGGSEVQAAVTLSYDGQPLVGHEVVIFVNQLHISGAVQVFDPDNPQRLGGVTAVGERIATRMDRRSLICG